MKFKEFSKKIEKFCDQKSQYLANFSIDDKEVDDSSKVANDYFAKMKSEEKKLEKAKFNNVLLNFIGRAFWSI